MILTSFDDDEALFAAVMAGASGYLLKQIGGSSLVDGIRQVAAGRSLVDPAVTRKLLERIRHPVEPDPVAGSLTAREREILSLNSVLADDSIIFRTVPDGQIFHHALDSMCAFEIDDTDEFFESGWSVVAIGRLELATGDDFDHMRYGKFPQPWATGNRYMFVRLPCTQVSGRRVIGHGR